MREIHFDLSTDSYFPSCAFGGFEGEHHATSVSLTLPDRLLSEGAEYYLIFEIAKSGETVFSAPLVLREKTLTASLPRQVMRAPRVSVHAAAYRRQGEELTEIAKSARVMLEIKNPEGEQVVPYCGDGGEIPGLVIEKSLLPDSENPVSSKALHSTLTAIAQDQITRGFVSGDGELVFTKKSGQGFIAGYVIGPQGERGETGEKGEKGEKGDTAPPDYSLVANALKGKAEGETVALKDVSPLEHELSVKVSPALGSQIHSFYDNGGTVTLPKYGYYTVTGVEVSEYKDYMTLTFAEGTCAFDLYTTEIPKVGDILYYGEILGHEGLWFGVVVHKYGKNLLDLDKCTFSNCTYNTESGTVKSNIRSGYFCSVLANYLCDFFLANQGKTFTFSLNECPSQRCVGVVLQGTRSNGATYYEAVDYDSKQREIDFTVPNDFLTMTKVEFRLNRSTIGQAFTDTATEFYNLQAEYGATATEYEKQYIEPAVYYPDIETGAVKGIVGSGESMTLSTEGATITAEYNRDLNKVIQSLEKIIHSIGG